MRNKKVPLTIKFFFLKDKKKVQDYKDGDSLTATFIAITHLYEQKRSSRLLTPDPICRLLFAKEIDIVVHLVDVTYSPGSCFLMSNTFSFLTSNVMHIKKRRGAQL